MSVGQLTDNVHLATSAWSIYIFWIGRVPQSIVYLPRSYKFFTNLFYIHTWHRMIKAARHDKNGMLQSLPWSVGHSLSDMMSASCRSTNQPIRRNQKHQSVFLNISSQAENCEASECWRTVFGLAINKPLPKDLEALWSFMKILQSHIKSWLQSQL